MKEWLRSIPPVHELQKDPEYIQIADEFGIDSAQVHQILTHSLNHVRDEIIKEIWQGPPVASNEFVNWLWTQVRIQVKAQWSKKLKKVINATGTVLHTNLGRAPLSKSAIERIVQTASSYSNLEYNLTEGKRGSRHDLIENMLLQLTGGEAALVVNNNAAAVFLVLRALAREKEVIISRGQLVEIGGSFRVSSIMEESGAVLKEVGTTNKTHLHDYVHALSENTAMVMKVHTSNFKMIGFTKTVPVEELVSLKEHKSNLIVYEDLGSGVLYDFREDGIGEEPKIQSVINSGVDLISFSGDKMLGGPQAGIIIGRKVFIDRLKKHPLTRALRVDKMTLAGLEATLLHYSAGEKGLKEIPVIRNILLSKEEIFERSQAFIRLFKEKFRTFHVNCKESCSQVGGGAMPDVQLETYVITVRHDRLDAHLIEEKLRKASTPIIVKIRDDEIQLDLRTVEESDYQDILSAFSLMED
ncbi:L-seryl-tRNA(Sec) selenium transferase [Bacillus oleivorans]|uniref:L-seryl-tRNA(Sec) selenium transferase n=1 Tax=Bacillus oleivorans TaxID=1448271 RepID=A0A285D588_9BACI|nr:L-seryl-tRNA(Sec) selenium transferase [Bacillus oleivorans]SNX74960.1 L-seryl-tRNA(Sec) selenium transferase [Bacillus oleivorans]